MKTVEHPAEAEQRIAQRLYAKHTIQVAIDDSYNENRIIRLTYSDALRDELVARAHDSVDADEFEAWGTDGRGDWRVHLVRPGFVVGVEADGNHRLG